jgi:hypothetical protein
MAKYYDFNSDYPIEKGRRPALRATIWIALVADLNPYENGLVHLQMIVVIRILLEVVIVSDQFMREIEPTNHPQNGYRWCFMSFATP